MATPKTSSSDYMVHFVANLLAIRTKRGISQRELARRLKVTPQNICAIERGRRGPVTIETATKIAEALGVSVSTLLARK